MHRRKKTAATILILICSAFAATAAIYSRPRRVSVIRTDYFDYIFPRDAEKTVRFLAENGDAIFKKAAEQFALKKTFRLPVAISLDSDTLSVSYTATPYNRITVFQSPAAAQSIFTEDALLTSFSQAVTEAVASSVKGKFWQFASDFIGMDALQPAALLNIPAAFMDGVINAAVFTDGDGILNDGFSLELLGRAKKEGRFPSWIDAAGSKDTYPAEISRTAYSAFAAYIQQRWGMDTFIDFWQKCGSVNFFKITPGIFRKVYKIPLKEAWKDFEDSIPLPPTVDFGKTIKTDASPGTFSCLTAYNGNLIFFDSVKSGIFLLDRNQKRKRLFTATNVTSLSLSPDKKYLAVSYSAKQVNRTLSRNTVQIYNLERRLFQTEYLRARNGTFFENKKDSTALAGFCTKDNHVQLVVFPFFNEAEEQASFTFPLPDNIMTEGIIPLGIGKLLCIYYYGTECILHTVNTFTQESTCRRLPLRAKDFSLCNTEDGKLIFFTCSDGTPYSIAKAGYIPVMEDGSLGDAFFTEESVDGGMHSVSGDKDSLYFSSHTMLRHELKTADFYDFRSLRFSSIQTAAFEIPESEDDKSGTDAMNAEPDKTKAEKYQGGFYEESYKPLRYMFKGTWFPFFPIASFDFTKTALSPGLGATYYTSTDPLETLTSALSFCAGFIDLSEKTFTVDNNYTLAATLNSTVLPVDLSLSGIWSFDKYGHYNLQAMLGVSWNIFIGMSFHNFTLGIKGLWKCSTTYLDYETNTTIELDGWPSIPDAYNTFSSYFNIQYENYHQSGMSSFEQRGIEAGATLISVYDPQKKNKPDDNKATQFTAAVNFGFKLPYILPVFNTGNWVICMPLTFYTDLYGQNGTFSESFIETLLAGYEIQKGIPGVNLYLNRFGIKFGYDIKLSYDELQSPGTDFRDFYTFLKVLLDSEIDDYFYISLEATLSPAIGKFADSVKITAGVQFQMDIRESKGRIAAIFDMNL